MAGFGFFRTIWITLRASNYTTRAFQDTIKNLSKLEQEQIRFRLNAMRNMIAVGTMYLAFGGIAIQAIANVMNASRQGQRVLERFGESTSKSIGKLGDAFASILGVILPVIAKFLEIVVAIPFLKELIALITLAGTVYLFAAGAVKIFTGAMGILNITHAKNIVISALGTKTIQTQLIPATKAATVSTLGLASALGLVTAGFTVFILLGQIIGNNAGMIVAGLAAITLAVLALAIALNILSLGTLSAAQLGAAALGAGMAAGVMAIQSGQEFQMGTSFVRKGGMAVLHEGEEIKSARESENMGRIKERRDVGQSFNRTTNVITLNLNGNLETKADNETLMPAVRRALREELDRKV